MDFEEVREYAIGDDVRSIDWNVSAKMDRPFVKVFREERELTLMLLVDLSASGIFGSVEQSKRERAAEIASVMAFSASQNNDKVGLILYTDTVEHYIPPKKGRRHILRLIRDLLFFKPRGTGTDHQAALDYLNRVTKRKSVVFLISDFLESDIQNHRAKDQAPDRAIPHPVSSKTLHSSQSDGGRIPNPDSSLRLPRPDAPATRFGQYSPKRPPRARITGSWAHHTGRRRDRRNGRDRHRQR